MTVTDKSIKYSSNNFSSGYCMPVIGVNQIVFVCGTTIRRMVTIQMEHLVNLKMIIQI